LETIIAGNGAERFLRSKQADIRARVLLAMAAGDYKASLLVQELGISVNLEMKLRQAYVSGGLDLVMARRCPTFAKLTAGTTAARVLDIVWDSAANTRRAPPAGVKQWNLSRVVDAAAALGITISTASVNRILRKAGVTLGARRGGPGRYQKLQNLHLKRGERIRLSSLIASPATDAEVRTRAAVLLRLGEGAMTLREIRKECHCCHCSVYKVRLRYLTEGLEAALEGAPRGAHFTVATPEAAAAILALSREPLPSAGLTKRQAALLRGRWSMSLLAREAVARGIVPAVSPGTVTRILKQAEAAELVLAAGRPRPADRFVASPRKKTAAAAAL
jgi:transposase